jgi:hypothetical protein
MIPFALNPSRALKSRDVKVLACQSQDSERIRHFARANLCERLPQ